MGLTLNPFAKNTPTALLLDEDLNNRLYTQARERTAVGIRPYRSEGGLEKGERLLNSLHDVERAGFLNRKNDSAAHAFELHYTDTDETLSFRFIPGDTQAQELLSRQLKTFYEDSDITDPRPTFMNTEPGDYIAGAELTLRQSRGAGKFRPIKHFKIDPDHFAQDPYDAITAEMINDAASAADADVLIQVVIKPAISDPSSRKKWYRGIENAAEELNTPRTEFKKSSILQEAGRALSPDGSTGGADAGSFSRELAASPEQKQAANVVANQYGKKGYHVNIRVFAASENKAEAESRANKTAKMFRKFYDSKFEQGFKPRFKTDDSLRELIDRGASREFEDTGITFSSDTVVNFCHVPTDINTQQTDYTMSTSGRGIPPGTPRFDFDTAGIADADALTKQTALLNVRDRDDPFWYGWGTKNNVEAGVPASLLNVHQSVNGGTGFGKSTLLNNFAYQVAMRDHGLLYFDPKGTGDAEDFLRVIPEDREDDVIFIEVGADRDRQVGFNFLEPPVSAPPDSSSFNAGIESMGDDIEALLAQSGGDQDYWGPRMKQISRNLVRGMAKSGMQCTLFDQWAALNPEGMSKYADKMTEERIDFIEDFARDELQEMDEADIRPVKSRYQQWVENPIIRDLVSYPESTVSIEDAVAEGKIIIVSNKVASDTVKRLFATALIRRTWMAVREQTYREESPPPFFVICDEFDSIVTQRSNIHSVLSEARAFDYCLTLATQNPSNQLPEQVANAIENQCRTFLSFNSGGEQDAQYIAGQHSKDIEPDDLTNLSSYRVYMRTEDDHGDLTHSYKVDAFPPIGWALDERDDEEVEALIEHSLAQYGSERRTAADIKHDSEFYSGAMPGEDTAEADDTFAVTPTVTGLTCKAVFDQQLRNDTDSAHIDSVADRIRRYLDTDDLDTRAKLWGDLLEHIPENKLEREERDDGIYLRCTDAGKTAIFASGSAQNSGSGKHRMLLRELYEPLTRAGFVIEIPSQDGSDLPDAVGSLEDVSPLQFDESLSPKEIHDLYETFASSDEYALLNRLSDGDIVSIEAESSTANTKAGQTIQNLAQARQRGERCLFVCREDTAANLWTLLAEAPKLMRSSDGSIHRLYNGADLSIGGKKLYRPTGGQSVWRHDERTGEYILELKDDEIRFDSAAAVFNHSENYPYVEGEITDYDDYQTIKTPIIPEHEAGGPIPDDAWDILVPVGDDLSLYEDGDLTPLSGIVERENETTTSPLADI